MFPMCHTMDVFTFTRKERLMKTVKVEIKWTHYHCETDATWDISNSCWCLWWCVQLAIHLVLTTFVVEIYGWHHWLWGPMTRRTPKSNDWGETSIIMGAHCVKVSGHEGEPIEHFKSPPVLLGEVSARPESRGILGGSVNGRRFLTPDIINTLSG